MNLIEIDFKQIPQLSKRDIAYVQADEKLDNFYKYAVSIDAFKHIIKDKKQDNSNRKLLAASIKKQYQKLNDNSNALAQIELLKQERTFTVTTAHQPSLFTGPLYYVYKIVSTLNLAEQLNKKYVGYNFVPIFWIGGEDHDFEEVNHLHLFGKTPTWEQENRGSVGKLSTNSLQDCLEEVCEMLGQSENAIQLSKILKRAYKSGKTYGESTFEFTHELFKNTNLLIMDASTTALKQSFIPFIKKEIFENTSQTLVQKTQQDLESAGFPAQAFPRPINFFYVGSDYRKRIIFENNIYKVKDTTITWDKPSLEAEIEAHPERFSPNVIMRPIYQEFLLPNLAYIGGGGEIAYWLERKTQFDAFGINFPMLIRRDSVLWIDKASTKKMEKLDLTINSLFKEEQSLLKTFVKANTEHELSLKAEKEQVEQAFQSLAQKIKTVDASLEKKALSEMTKALKSVEMLEGRLLKAEKQRQEVQLNQISKLKGKLFPNGSLQERYDNFIPFYLKYGDDFIKTLQQQLNPLDFGFKVLVEV